VRALAADRCGSTAIEYAMIAGIISIVIVAAATQIGSQVQNMFSAVIAPFL
jgi:pilus assembly protein Flp/PilA